MAASTDKSTCPPEWVLLYHAGNFKGRGEFLRLMFEDSGTPYEKNDPANLYGPTGMVDLFRGSVAGIDDEVVNSQQSYPLLSVPAIWHRPPKGGEEVLINQTGACMIYLGDMLGYAPSSPSEKARATMILLNCLDYISDGRSSFHPVKNTMSYHDQKEEGDRVSKEFSQGRMKSYLHHFNKVVMKSGPTKPVAGGEKITFADFALFHVLDASVFQFNTEAYDMAWDHTAIPALKEYYAWFKARPLLQAYFASDRCGKFAGDSMM